MRSILCILLAVVMLLSLTACKKKAAADPADPAASVSDQSETVSSSTTEDTSVPESTEVNATLPDEASAGADVPTAAAPVEEAPPVSSAPPVPLEEKMISGSIEDASMNTIMIKTDEGKIRAFSTMDADKSACNGLETGSRVEIYYTGEMAESNTGDVTVTRLVQP